MVNGFSILVVMRIHRIGFKVSVKSHLSVRGACMFHYGQWNTERYLSDHWRMEFLQYGTGCAGECSEVTKSTVPYLLKVYQAHFR